jgi:anti-sigma regulatory factor (Ser/Thr protein kinase)
MPESATSPIEESRPLLGEHHVTLDNDPALLAPLIADLQQWLENLGHLDGRGRFRVGVALEEALLNAIHHGNLEVSSELRQEDDRAYRALIERRRGELPYQARRVEVRIRVFEKEVVFVIRDDGPGFDPAAVPEPTDEVGLSRPSGRGLLLIRRFMDEVSHNDRGNEITMIKRR